MPVIHVRDITIQYDLPRKRPGRFSIWWREYEPFIVLGAPVLAAVLIIYVKFFR